MAVSWQCPSDGREEICGVVSLDYFWIVSYGCFIQKQIRELQQTPMHLPSSSYFITTAMFTVLLQYNIRQPGMGWLLIFYVPFMVYFQLSQPPLGTFLSPDSPSYSKCSCNELSKNLLRCTCLKGICTFLILSFWFSSEKTPQPNTTTSPCQITKRCCFSSEPFSTPFHF